jgi:hypothetical protein
MCNSCIWVCITNLSMCSFCRYWHPYRRGRTKQKCTTLKCIRWCSWKYSRNKNKCLNISRHLIFVFLIIAFIICNCCRPLKIIWYSWPIGVPPPPTCTSLHLNCCFTFFGLITSQTNGLYGVYPPSSHNLMWSITPPKEKIPGGTSTSLHLKLLFYLFCLITSQTGLVWCVSSIITQINVASVLTWPIWLIWQGRLILCFHLFFNVFVVNQKSNVHLLMGQFTIILFHKFYYCFMK